MRMPHHCHECGTDLTRLLARIDEALRLPLVRCPACARVQVRRPIQAPRIRRRLLRAAAAGVLLLIQLGLLAAATAMTAAAAHLLMEMVDDLVARRRVPFEELVEGLPGARFLPLLIPGGIFALVGIWHGISFAHVLPRAPRGTSTVLAVLAFLLWVLVCTAAFPFLDAIEREGTVQGSDLLDVVVVAVGLVAGAPILFGASAVGRSAVRSRQAARRGRWRKRLAQRRMPT